jgi:CRP/FNR family transcriptional regulator, putaive post-exponential-phase nitrogen-starvation regulator
MLARTYFNSKNQNYELKNRLAAYILMSQNNGIYSEKHTETAEYLSVSYRHLLYTFKEFINDDVVVKIKKGYRVDLEALGVLSKDIELT